MLTSLDAYMLTPQGTHFLPLPFLIRPWALQLSQLLVFFSPNLIGCPHSHYYKNSKCNRRSTPLILILPTTVTPDTCSSNTKPLSRDPPMVPKYSPTNSEGSPVIPSDRDHSISPPTTPGPSNPQRTTPLPVPDIRRHTKPDYPPLVPWHQPRLDS